MANLYARNNSSIKASPSVKVKVKELGGRMRCMFDEYTMGTDAGQIGDVILFGRLPKGALVHYARVDIVTDDFGAAVTFDIGNSAGLNKPADEAADPDSIDAALAGSALSSNQYWSPTDSPLVYHELGDEVEITATVGGAAFDTANPTAKLIIEVVYSLD